MSLHSTDVVSVVVPCFNVADVVEASVASVLRQTRPPVEIVCVDDGSTDETLRVLRRLEQRHDHVRVLSGPNRGAPAARNRGMAAVSGAYIQFLDADDTLDEDKLERQVAAALSGEVPADLVVGSYRRRLLDGRTKTIPTGIGVPTVDLIEKRLGITSANLWRREAVEAAGGWNEAWESSQEAELMARMLRLGACVAYAPTPATTLHEREGSISRAFGAAARERFVRVRADALVHARQAGTLDSADLRQATDAVFTAIRMLYPFDRSAALDLLDQAIPRGFVPAESPANSAAYVRAYRWFGMRGAETLRRLAGRTPPDASLSTSRPSTPFRLSIAS